jgi:hypothetical protein
LGNANYFNSSTGYSTTRESAHTFENTQSYRALLKAKQSNSNETLHAASTMKTYSLILAICCVSFLDHASAWSVHCVSNSDSDADVVEACPGLNLEEVFTAAMEAEALLLGLPGTGRRTRNLRADDERELTNGCAYCSKYPERWCQECPYTDCRRQVLELETNVIDDRDCVALLEATDTEFKEKLIGETNSTACVEALNNIQCGCDV